MCVEFGLWTLDWFGIVGYKKITERNRTNFIQIKVKKSD